MSKVIGVNTWPRFYTDIFNLLLSNFDTERLVEYINKLKGKGKLFIINRANSYRLSDRFNPLSDEQKLKLLKLLQETTNIMDFDIPPNLAIHKYVISLEQRITELEKKFNDLENMIVYHPDNEDIESPMKKAKADFESRK